MHGVRLAIAMIRNTHSQCRPDKQHVDREGNRDCTRLVMELVIQAPGNRTAQAKRQHHAGEPHAQRHPPVRHEELDVDLQADEEEEQHKAEIGDEVEVRHCGGGEDGVLKARDAHHDGGSEDNSPEDFSDDAGLAQLGEGPVEEATEDHDDSCLRRCISW